MYSIAAYGQMISDRVRMRANVEALRRAVTPDSVVLDIGTGAGIFAVLASQWGARRVYAVEPEDVIHLAREIARANRVADRIEFHQGLSTALTLPERADVVISDLRGVLPFFGRHIPSIIDARRRLLAPQGVLIPQVDTLWCACVESEDAYRRIDAPWSAAPFGVDLRPGREMLANNWTKISIEAGALLSSPGQIGTVDYRTVDTPDLAAQHTVTIGREGTAHGLCVWFDATLAPGVGFSNAPGQDAAIYGAAFFPWLEPVTVAEGDIVTINLRATLVDDAYVWIWNSRVVSGESPHRVKADYRQSTFRTLSQSLATLQRSTETHVPTLTEEGRMDLIVLTMMQEGVVLGQIAERLSVQYPDRFSNWREALGYVGQLSLRYSR